MKKDQIQKFNPGDNQLLRVVGEVQEGNIDALTAYIYLWKVKKAAEEALARVEKLQDLPSLATQYPKGEPIDGLLVSVQNTPSTYKYSAHVSALEEGLKRRKKLEQQAAELSSRGQMLIDEGTGEVVPPANVVSGQPKLYISIPKT